MSQVTHTLSSDDDGVIAEMPDLKVEGSHSEDMLILEQTDYCSNTARIAIHRWQVRFLAEEMGLLPAAAPVPRRDVVVILARRLRKLHERIDDLGRHLTQFSDDEHAKAQILATCELGDEFLADLDELLGDSEQVRNAQVRTHGSQVRTPVRTESASASALRTSRTNGAQSLLPV